MNFRIINLMGVEIRSGRFLVTDPELTERMDITGLNSGIYFIQFYDDHNQVQTAKFQVAK
ncbi:MAG: T9SS type A sorting domain-containing protein [Candidatus Levybacteria bacterium]|nr:T9SS type A sorting domain-containing protein [Candidatus Levybacteria bacterium]